MCSSTNVIESVRNGDFEEGYLPGMRVQRQEILEYTSKETIKICTKIEIGYFFLLKNLLNLIEWIWIWEDVLTLTRFVAMFWTMIM